MRISQTPNNLQALGNPAVLNSWLLDCLIGCSLQQYGWTTLIIYFVVVFKLIGNTVWWFSKPAISISACSIISICSSGVSSLPQTIKTRINKNFAKYTCQSQQVQVPARQVPVILYDLIWSVIVSTLPKTIKKHINQYFSKHICWSQQVQVPACQVPDILHNIIWRVIVSTLPQTFETHIHKQFANSLCSSQQVEIPRQVPFLSFRKMKILMLHCIEVLQNGRMQRFKNTEHTFDILSHQFQHDRPYPGRTTWDSAFTA